MDPIVAVMNKARSRNWSQEYQTRKGVTFLVFTKETDTVTLRLNSAGDFQSAKVKAKRVDHAVKSETYQNADWKDTVSNWLEW